MTLSTYAQAREDGTFGSWVIRANPVLADPTLIRSNSGYYFQVSLWRKERVQGITPGDKVVLWVTAQGGQHEPQIWAIGYILHEVQTGLTPGEHWTTVSDTSNHGTVGVAWKVLTKRQRAKLLISDLKTDPRFTNAEPLALATGTNQLLTADELNVICERAGIEFPDHASFVQAVKWQQHRLAPASKAHATLGAPTADRQENLAISRAAVDAGEGALAGTTADARARMAKAALEMVARELKDGGYRVFAVDKDHPGWQLTAVKKGAIRHIAVQGHSGDQPSVFLTVDQALAAHEDQNWELAAANLAHTESGRAGIRYHYGPDLAPQLRPWIALLANDEHVGVRPLGFHVRLPQP